MSDTALLYGNYCLLITVLMKKQEQREIFYISLLHQMLSSMESDYMEFVFRFLTASSETGKGAILY